MEHAAIILPLISALIAGIFGKLIGNRASNFITCSLMLVAALCSISIFDDVALHDNVKNIQLFTWVASGDLSFSWAIFLDQLSSLMVMLVNVIAFCAHLYSVGFMHGDKKQNYFMSYMSMFTFAMLMLVTSSNFAQMFFGWEGVALASYLLISFNSKKEAPNKAAQKSFIMNRIGDCSFVVAIALIYFVFGSVEFTDIFLNYYSETVLFESEEGKMIISLLGFNIHAVTLICSLLLVAAMTKSAQLGFHTWLADAMEAPIPASALIHAATMVSAGVFMIARCSALFEASHGVLTFITIIGALTAFVAATIALVETDIKKIVSYSTMSQLGLMFVALGISAYGAAIFHLFTHAFFKGLLFLCVGAVVKALDGRQDITKMGALFKFMPVTAVLMWVATLSLTAIPYFAGYYSQDAILASMNGMNSNVSAVIYNLTLASVFVTALYSWRLLFSVFHAKQHESKGLLNKVNDPGYAMIIPMHVLTLGALFAGWWFNNIFVGEDSASFWVDSLIALDFEYLEDFSRTKPVLLSSIAILIAYIFYVANPKLPAKWANKYDVIYSFLKNKYYFDELYNFIIVKPVLFISDKLARTVEIKIIDRFGPNLVAGDMVKSSRIFSRMQTGYLYHYLFSIVIGLLAFIAAFLIMGGK